MAERALGPLREKAIPLEELDNAISVPREKLWAQAMLFVCEVNNKSATSSTDGGKSLYKPAPTPDHLPPFGVVGYARWCVHVHKIAPKTGKVCVYRNSPQLPQWHGQCATREDQKDRGKARHAVDRRA